MIANQTAIPLIVFADKVKRLQEGMMMNIHLIMMARLQNKKTLISPSDTELMHLKNKHTHTHTQHLQIVSLHFMWQSLT